MPPAHDAATVKLASFANDAVAHISTVSAKFSLIESTINSSANGLTEQQQADCVQDLLESWMELKSSLDLDVRRLALFATSNTGMSFRQVAKTPNLATSTVTRWAKNSCAQTLEPSWSKLKQENS